MERQLVEDAPALREAIVFVVAAITMATVQIFEAENVACSLAQRRA